MSGTYRGWTHWPAQRPPFGLDGRGIYFCCNDDACEAYYAVTDDFGDLVQVADIGQQGVAS